MGEDTRINPLLTNLKNQYTGPDYGSNKNKKPGEAVTADMVDGVSGIV